ncbi:MAG: RDD family protein [Firmicutes bacterium]|nr:RDD family protein [Bacillota bacterium]
MNAGFFKRAFSSLIDITIVLAVVAATFYIAGRSILRNQISNFDIIFTAYNEVIDAYNSDYDAATEEFNVQMDIADGDTDLEALASQVYQARVQIINDQNLIDIEPYNRSLTRYFMNNIYYFSIGFLILIAIYTVAFNGKTLGRRVMNIALDGPVNPVSVFFHDVILKYFFVILVFMVSVYIGLLLLALSIIIDIVLISFTKNKTTLRDVLLRMTVSNKNYWK